MKKLILLGALLAFPLTGCAALIHGPPVTYTTLTGTVQDTVEAMNWNAMRHTWSAQLLVSPDYNGSPNVNIGNDGNDECVFRDFIHNGDQLTIQVQAGSSLNELDASDVTVNGTPLSTYSGESC